jgi:hypothetical protein
MQSRPYEGIVPKVPADVRLNHLTADAVSWNEILILALRALKRRCRSMASGHDVQAMIKSQKEAQG